MLPEDLAGLSLDEAMIGAAEAPPSVRIEYRDPIARYGSAAVAALTPWLNDRDYSTFAVQAIARAASFGAETEAVAALRSALQSSTTPLLEGDIRRALERLGAPARTAPSGHGARKVIGSIRPREDDPGSVLRLGETYKRTDLHDRFGGNRQSGISYPVKGNFAMLFSDPAAAHVLGYRDRWQDGTYRYYGAWSGEGDMVLTAQNRVVQDRSPNLFLFLKAGDLWRFEGRFECVGLEHERTDRDGGGVNAFVFVLRPVSARPGAS